MWRYLGFCECCLEWKAILFRFLLWLVKLVLKNHIHVHLTEISWNDYFVIKFQDKYMYLRFFCLFVCFFWSHLTACGTLVSQPDIESASLKLEVQSLDHHGSPVYVSLWLVSLIQGLWIEATLYISPEDDTLSEQNGPVQI